MKPTDQRESISIIPNLGKWLHGLSECCKNSSIKYSTGDFRQSPTNHNFCFQALAVFSRIHLNSWPIISGRELIGIVLRGNRHLLITAENGVRFYCFCYSSLTFLCHIYLIALCQQREFYQKIILWTLESWNDVQHPCY